jgi:TDG/mug DNA glycosylase family protein
MTAFIHSFSAITKENVRSLILGSMPGKASLVAKEYYAHPRNNFWKFMQSLKNIQLSVPYEMRCKQLADSGIALWDVLKTCTRTSSLDSDIVESSIVANDFEGFLSKHSNISTIYFNGAKAEQIYLKYVLPKLPVKLAQIKTVRLPSTSPANASIPLDVKIKQWSVISTY